jgi:tetratricopeptide (TPR) repeat protein
MSHTSGEQPGSGSQNGRQQLDSWKEIAIYLHRTVATVKRWEKKEGLPVHRHLHHKRSTVYAYPSEIDAWLTKRRIASGLAWSSIPSHNRNRIIGFAAGLTALLIAGLFIGVSTDSPQVPGNLAFRERDWVLITDFENRSGEPVLDGVLEHALQREIANSQFVNVVPRERIEDTLQLMRKPLDTRIDRSLGRDICLRDGEIKALLTGRVEKLDSTYLLSIELVDPVTAQSIAATSKEATGQKQVLSALRSLANWSRERLGENLALIQESEQKLEKVTTDSLQALQLFTKADALIGQGESDVAEELLKQAVDIDPEFASAYMHLAHALRNQRKPAEEYMRYHSIKGEQERAIHSYETLLSLYPDHFWATNNLANHFRLVGQQQRALTYQLRRADLRPNNFGYTHEAAYYLLREGDSAAARTYWSRARDLITPEDLEKNPDTTIPLMWFPVFQALLNADPETAFGEANRLLDTLRRLEGRDFVNYQPSRAFYPLGAFYFTLGKIGLAREWSEKTQSEARRHYNLASIAYLENDHEAMRKHLEQWFTTRKSRLPTTTLASVRERVERTNPSVRQAIGRGCCVVMLLARSGLFSEAEEWLSSTIITPNLPDPDVERIERRREIERGVLALSGRTRDDEGIKMLEDALFRPPKLIRLADFSAAAYLLGSEVLAEAWRGQGNLGEAVQVLKAASEKKYLLLAEQSLLTGPLWLRLQAQLAQLYREMSRDEEAREIEKDLRQRLALADADHPILRQLNRTKEIALRASGN